MAESYGLYTHIRANRTRSVLLLAGLFLLIYVLVFAALLIWESQHFNRPLDWLLRAAWHELPYYLPWATLGALAWIIIAYQYHQKLIDAITGGQEVTRQESPRLYNLLENL